ncbi:Rapamycin-insensitive companion of mTOR AVO3 -like protein [Triplophysa tibetana]|uniref:Rapamycin-insensitive companion of mTOR AVO3-like protein n=1 Tax=Triplophysa tibetana TaxID=1572043 RepID=A0A5A9PDX6_9TELE|nr:Rapamycin-insensitive companion of mTOR AVO3 -like protein [Triplophysa tibetana]
MAVSIRGRPIRSIRMRGRNDSGEENVPLDLTRDPCENMREILQNVAKQQGVSNMRKLGHLNNFVKLLCNVGHSEEKFGYTYEEIIICLRLALLNEAKEVRAAGLRALRYLIRDCNILQKVLRLQVDYLISRCIDIQQSNEVERTQALRLVRKMITVNALLFPSSVANSLIAVGNDGLQERDRMVRACIAIICELALENPEIVAKRGGLSTILKNVIDCQLSRINEALITTILHLLNHPQTRQYVRSDVELEVWRSWEDREARFLASKMSIVASFRSWAGIINLCKSGNSGIQSLIGLLCIPNMEVRQGLLEVMYDIFRLPVPVATQDFIEALLSVDPGRFQDTWRLSDGFVASEAKIILPHRARSRPDLMDNYLALLLSAFIQSGLLEGLVEVITSSDNDISVRATILLGELLHMANIILPHSHSHHLHCLPTLINMAASFDIPQEKRLRASAAVNYLKRFHERKKRGPKPSSLYLDQIIRKSLAAQGCRDQHIRPQRDIFVIKDSEEALMLNLKESQILYHKQNLDWNWILISTILKWPNVNLRNNKDEQMHRFVRRLLFFYKPSSKLYASLELDHSKAKQLTVVGCQFIEFLLESDEDGQVYLEDLVKDIVQWLSSSSGLKPDRSLQSNGLLITLSQHYFLFLGTLSAHPQGVKMLEKCSVFQCLLNLCTLKNQDHLLKLIVSTLDYSRDGLARVILSKILTAATDNGRLYATKHLRVLLRANVEFFSNWGMELLVTQLHDRNKAVSMEALDILDEACEDKNVVPDLSYTVRCPVLDKWEGIKQLKAALWGLGNIGTSNWGLNLLQEENVVPDIVALAHDCEVLSIRGTCLYVLGLISKTKQGCELLKLHGWDAVRHNRRQLWPVVTDEVEQHLNPQQQQTPQQQQPLIQLSSAPSTLSLNSESTGSRHNSESDSTQPSMYIMDDDKLESPEDHPLYFRPKLPKDRSPFTILSSSRLVRNRFLISLSGKKLRSTSDPKGTGSSDKLQGEQTFGGLRRNRTVTEPSMYSPVQGDMFSPVFTDGHLPKSPSVSLETSFVGIKTPDTEGSTFSIGDPEVHLHKTAEQGGGGDGKREQTSRERLAGDGSTSGGGPPFKSRSQSFNTDTTTSGISSMSSSPSRETVGGVDSSTNDTDCISLNTVISTQTIKTLNSLKPQTNHLPLSKSNSVLLMPPGSSHTLPRRAHSLKSPSVTTISSLTDCSFMYTSQRDALGYATLKRLQQQRIHPSLSHSEALASPAKDVLFTDAITMKTGSLDSRLTPRRYTKKRFRCLGQGSNRPHHGSLLPRFLKALSFASLDKEDLLSPISQTSLQRSSSVRSMVSSATYGHSDDYIGLALPMDINSMFQIKDIPYFQKRTSPPSEDRSAKFFSGDVDGSSDGSRNSVLRSQLSITELIAASQMDHQQLLGGEETGLQEHSDENCLYCAGLHVLGCNSDTSTQNRPEYADAPYSEWCNQTIHNLEVMPQSKFSGVSCCSDAVSQSSVGSTRSTELVLGVKNIPEDAPACRVLLRKEVLRLVINLSSSVGTKGNETGLLTIKEKFPYAFDDICLYSEVSYLLAHCMFRLASRRFIQELFQDVQFIPMYEEAESILSKPKKSATIDPPSEP